jgi:NAD-dependent SIR2 family protein deacetylase
VRRLTSRIEILKNDMENLNNEPTENEIAVLFQLLSNKNVVVITGAGISTASG